jgi:hypothetical protein
MARAFVMEPQVNAALADAFRAMPGNADGPGTSVAMQR